MNGSDRGGAGLFATPTFGSAHLAVLMPASVPLAFFRTDTARQGAGLDHSLEDLLVRPGPARGKHTCRLANIGAVEIEPDALL